MNMKRKKLDGMLEIKTITELFNCLKEIGEISGYTQDGNLYIFLYGEKAKKFKNPST